LRAFVRTELREHLAAEHLQHVRIDAALARLLELLVLLDLFLPDAVLAQVVGARDELLAQRTAARAAVVRERCVRAVANDDAVPLVRTFATGPTLQLDGAARDSRRRDAGREPEHHVLVERIDRVAEVAVRADEARRLDRDEAR